MFGMFKGKDRQTSAKIDRSISTLGDLNAEQEYLIETMSKDGMTPSQIEVETGIPRTIVYRYKAKRMSPDDFEPDPEDRLREMKDKIRETELEMKLEGMRYDLEMKRLELENMRRDAMSDLMSSTAGDVDGMDAEALLMKILTPLLQPQQAPGGGSTNASYHSPPGAAQPPTPTLQDANDEQIRELLKSFKKTDLRLAKRLPKDQLIQLVRQHEPNYQPRVYERAHKILMEEY